jgi:hypothetical protein
VPLLVHSIAPLLKKLVRDPQFLAKTSDVPRLRKTPNASARNSALNFRRFDF